MYEDPICRWIYTSHYLTLENSLYVYVDVSRETSTIQYMSKYASNTISKLIPLKSSINQPLIPGHRILQIFHRNRLISPMRHKYTSGSIEVRMHTTFRATS